MLDYGRKLAKFLPQDIASYDDASNNRALISGKSALIMNPPSAWAVAKRDAPQVAADCWHFPVPGRRRRGATSRTTTASMARGRSASNKTAAKELIQFLQERKQVEERCIASEGYDLPPLLSMNDFQIWSDVNPPKGTVYNYPIRPWHNAQENITGYPAPPEIAAQMYARAIHPTMLAKVNSGPVEQGGHRLGEERAGRLHSLRSRTAGRLPAVVWPAIHRPDAVTDRRFQYLVNPRRGTAGNVTNSGSGLPSRTIGNL